MAPTGRLANNAYDFWLCLLREESHNHANSYSRQTVLRYLRILNEAAGVTEADLRKIEPHPTHIEPLILTSVGSWDQLRKLQDHMEDT